MAVFGWLKRFNSLSEIQWQQDPPAHNEGGSLLKNLALAVLERTISAMIPAEFGALKTRITAHLRKEGVACSETLASELDAPHGSVRIALEELSEEKVKEVRRLPFGLWDVTENDERVA